MYTELGASSHYSFLRSVVDPELLAQRAAHLGYQAIALSDYAGVYGIPKFHQAAQAYGLRAIVGSSIDILDVGRVRLLCESQLGYQNLCRLITLGHAQNRKGHCQITLDTIAELQRDLPVSPGLSWKQSVPFLSPSSRKSLNHLISSWNAIDT